MAGARRLSAASLLLGTAALSWGATSASSLPARGASSRPLVTPRHGTPFVPSVGDWEGEVSGFPASFQLRFDASRTAGPYQSNDLVALRPSGCPPTASRYAEDVITARHAPAISQSGSLRLSPFGYSGAVTGGRSAQLTVGYRARAGTRACSGKLIWHLHPAVRHPVDDGVWRLRFADGESGTFRVRAGGRLATSVRVPSALTRCDGVSGSVDLFVAPDGSARLSRPSVQVSMQLSRSSASGQMDAGGRGCSRGPFRFRATPATR